MVKMSHYIKHWVCLEAIKSQDSDAGSGGDLSFLPATGARVTTKTKEYNN